MPAHRACPESVCGGVGGRHGTVSEPIFQKGVKHGNWWTGKNRGEHSRPNLLLACASKAAQEYLPDFRVCSLGPPTCC